MPKLVVSDPGSTAAPLTQLAQTEGLPGGGRRLGDLLLAAGLVNPEQLDKALAEHRRTGERLGAVLVRLGFISEGQLVQFLSIQYGIPALSPAELVTDAEVLRLVPVDIAKKYELIPLQRTSRSLTLAMADPTNLLALDDVAFMTGLKVVPAIAPQSAIGRAIAESYRTPPPTLADTEAEAEAEVGEIEIVEGSEAHVPDIPEVGTTADDTPGVRLVNTILLDAIRRGASDVHLEPFQMTMYVRLRIDGVLHEVMTLPKQLESAIVSRIKIMADMDIAERRLSQDGRIRLRYNSREVDLRVSTLPTIFGESVTMRLLDKESLKLDLIQLGFEARSLDHFRRAIHSPYGMILITGPTGSGKTTTLYSAIHALRSPDIKIITVEDPVEYNFHGINQVQVNEEIGRTFAGALRAFLRHDPDVILVGEMRDLETAQIAIRAALTGHLVLSTLHTNDCASTIARLVDMGIPPFLIASVLRVVVAQRLVRMVCKKCTEAYEADEESLVPYGYSPQGLGRFIFFRGKGCAVCNFTGMRGRIAIYEVMPVIQELRNLIVTNAPANDIHEAARRGGMKTLREAGLMKVIEGLTTVEEVLRVTSD